MQNDVSSRTPKDRRAIVFSVGEMFVLSFRIQEMMRHVLIAGI